MALGKKDWLVLDPDPIYLTHGSFGLCLKEAFDNRIKWQKKIERNPFDFIVNKAFDTLCNYGLYLLT